LKSSGGISENALNLGSNKHFFFRLYLLIYGRRL